MTKKLTYKQKARQDTEYREKGKYSKVNPCFACNKSAGVDYFSHYLTDCIGADGKNWGDIAICLCKKCADATQDMMTVDEFLNYSQKFKKGK